MSDFSPEFLTVYLRDREDELIAAARPGRRSMWSTIAALRAAGR